MPVQFYLINQHLHNAHKCNTVLVHSPLTVRHSIIFFKLTAVTEQVAGTGICQRVHIKWLSEANSGFLSEGTHQNLVSIRGYRADSWYLSESTEQVVSIHQSIQSRDSWYIGEVTAGICLRVYLGNC
jgi:hypothetical protein